MELSAITMPTKEALGAYEDYTQAYKRRHSEEDKAIALGYKALSEGKSIVSLSRVIREGGLDDRGFPRLAICRANSEWCWVDRRRDGSVHFSSVQRPRSRSVIVALPAKTLPEGG